ncbi:hypothetical protein BCL76_114212 [Streptomyces sp. CG 926]|uniref:hypothetical protein n=1 Tax=Streptomyces sp. CG 926 TaxID=1882405 RepID=UPI000D6B0FAB|nr:hypothetical protein [Streptomyces sp. CG 926]PWK64890.1 hypothetical protein BCL76_114212 [Streptomyces sp. CG 926]
MTTHLTRLLVPLTAVAAVAVGGLSMTSAVAATPRTAPALSAHTPLSGDQYTDPYRPGRPQQNQRNGRGRGHCFGYCAYGSSGQGSVKPQPKPSGWVDSFIHGAESVTGSSS